MDEISEHQIQSAFIEWVRIAEKQDERLKLLFAVPNGRKREKVTAAILKKEGVRAGVLDIFLPLRTDAFNGLAIEFKNPLTGKVSKEQRDFSALLVKYGWRVEICTDAEQAIKITKNYLDSIMVRMSYVPIAL